MTGNSGMKGSENLFMEWTSLIFTNMSNTSACFL